MSWESSPKYLIVVVARSKEAVMRYLVQSTLRNLRDLLLWTLESSLPVVQRA